MQNFPPEWQISLIFSLKIQGFFFFPSSTTDTVCQYTITTTHPHCVSTFNNEVDAYLEEEEEEE